MNLLLENIGLVSFSLNLLGYTVLAILLVISWLRGVFGAYLLLAIGVEIIWSAILAYHTINQDLNISIIISAELARFICWLVFIFKALEMAGVIKKNKLVFNVSLLGLLLGSVTVLVAANFPHWVFIDNGTQGFFIFAVLCAVAGLVLIEQLYRNVQPQNRYKIKFLCLSAGTIFVYDFYVFADALLLGQIDITLWDARGIVNLLAVPMIAISVSRLPSLSFELFISRQAVFFTSGLLATGSYLLLMAMGGYYIRAYGGSWGAVAQIGFLFATGLVLLAVFLSSYTRGKIKQFLSKHFYKNKYDYREEWMRLIHNVYEYQSPVYFKEKIIQTIAGLIQCRGGLLFLQNEDNYECDTMWNASTNCARIEALSSLVDYINKTEAVIDLHEYKHDKSKYPDLIIPECLDKTDSAWLIVPLKLHYRLLGFVVLLESPIQEYINWEDRDLFKAAGRQISSYLAFIQTSGELAEAQQFSAFNRLSAYLVHDLKNLVSQLELITINADKHMGDPEFVKDAILTVSNVVNKTKRMLSQLRKFQFDASGSQRINVADVLKRVIARKSANLPVPAMKETANKYFIFVEPERFENIIEHLIQNAQDATPEEGIIEIELHSENGQIIIQIRDTGCGMDKTFIRERLFKPFDTTKGNAGMGIGVYEAREFVKYHGGSIELTSEPGKGTTFFIKIPESLEDVH